MQWPALANHLLNFLAPAPFVALVLALLAQVSPGSNTAAGGRLRALWRSFWVNAAVGSAVLVAGLVAFGRDGAMWTYAALVVACASSQWLLSRAGRD